MASDQKTATATASTSTAAPSDEKSFSLSNTWKTSIASDGSFNRKPTAFHGVVTADGSSGFKAEAGRYHLYVSYACPWAHRTLVVRKLKGLDDVIDFTVVDWVLSDGGWRFCDDKPGCTLDPVNNFQFLRQVYFLTDPSYAGSITVPVLFDKKTQKIVNNESPEIIRMLNTAFNAFCKTPQQAALDFYPESLRAKIDEVNTWVYPNINNGVYRCGFARKQEPYDKAYDELFGALDQVESILSQNRFLCGDAFTEADIRLWTTLIRFDAVYYTHFKCNKKRIVDYPNIWAYTRQIYQLPGIKSTVDFQHIKHHYFVSHTSINPFSIVPKGPEIDYDAAHDRPALQL